MGDGAAVSVFRKYVIAAALFHVAVTAVPAVQSAQADASSAVLIVDSSNSMWSQIRGRGRFDITRRVLSKDFASYAGRFDLGIIAYGHRYKKSCSDIQTIMPIGEINARQYSRAIRRFTPKGKTPISRALSAAVKETNAGSPPDNIILLSDGLDNCGQNPCATASTLKSLNADLKVHVIAFSVPRDRESRLSCIAANTEGTFIAVKNEASLASATQTIFDLVATRNEEIAVPRDLMVAQVASDGGDVALPGALAPLASPADTSDLDAGSALSDTSGRGIPFPKPNPKAETQHNTDPILTIPELIGEPQPFSLPPTLSRSGTLGTGQVKEIVTLPDIPATPEMMIAPEIVSATEVLPGPEIAATPDGIAAPDDNVALKNTEAGEDVEALDFATPFEIASLEVTAVRDVTAKPRSITLPQIAAAPPIAEPPAIAAMPGIKAGPEDAAPTEIKAIPRLDAVAEAAAQILIPVPPEAKVAAIATKKPEAATPPEVPVESASDRMTTDPRRIKAGSAIADEPQNPRSSASLVTAEIPATLDIPASPQPAPSPPATASAGNEPEQPAIASTQIAVAPVTTGALSSDDPSSQKPPVKINIGDRPIPKLPDEVRPTFLISEEPVEPGEEGLTLRGKISSATATITRPIDWAAYKVEDAKTDRWRKIASVAMAEASISLPPGQYVVRASYGAARAAKVLEVKPGKRIDATFILNAGGLRILPGLAFLDTPQDIFAKHWVFGASTNEKGKRRLFAQSSAIGEVVRLNSGTYTLVSRFGNANAVVETNITIRPGTLTEVEINHKVGIVSFRMSTPPKNPTGDEAVKWQLVDDSGIIIVRADGPEMTQILAPGSYRVMVEHRGKSYTSEFMVEIGETKAVEIATM